MMIIGLPKQKSREEVAAAYPTFIKPSFIPQSDLFIYLFHDSMSYLNEKRSHENLDPVHNG